MEKVAGYIKDEKNRRRDNKYRKSHEKRWAQVDRMVAMDPEPTQTGRNDPAEGWESNIELGSLADASEIITADVMRIIFPSDREFFRPHVKIDAQLDPETGVPFVKPSQQKLVDGIYKSLMSQQHKDFGLRHRIKLSIKEALHHGSFVAVVRWETQKQITGGRVRSIGAPVWVPYSMWNCFPDDSPSVIGTNISYDGTMIIEEEIPLKTALQQKWMNLDKVKKDASKDKKDHITITHWYGDLFIKRQRDDGILVQNQHVITNNDNFLFAQENDGPYPPIVFSGYERDNVLDPYYTSPLIKRSPSQKLATHCANKFVEALDLRTKPPIGYDANEPAFRESGGPIIAPGEVYPLRAGGQIKAIEVADPSWALQGAQIFKAEVEEGTGVDVHRKGTSASVEQTAFEVDKVDQRSEVRTVDFVSTLESQGMKPFLYMQHEFNKRLLRPYGFFNTQLDTPDFMTLDKSDIQKYGADVHFEVVGSKGVLGEERRRRGAMEVTVSFAASPLFAPLLNVEEIMLDAYRDVGVKDPERYIGAENGEDPALAQLRQQAEEAIAMLQEENQALKIKVQEIPIMKAKAQAKEAAKEAQSTAFRSENKMLEEQIQLQAKADSREKQLFAAEKRLLVLRDQIGDLVLKARLEGTSVNENEFKEKESEFKELTKMLAEDRSEREQTKNKVVQFIKQRGSEEAKELVGDL
jgi:hypothetical protein